MLSLALAPHVPTHHFSHPPIKPHHCLDHLWASKTHKALSINIKPISTREEEKSITLGSSYSTLLFVPSPSYKTMTQGLNFQEQRRAKAVGLRILLHHHIDSPGEAASAVLVTSGLRFRRDPPPPAANSCRRSPLPAASSRHAASLDSSFLASCFLCNKKLCPHKDVYMYRGDQGFCSVECRSRQIVADEMGEMDETCRRKSKKRLQSPRHCRSTGRYESRALLNELRQRQNRLA